MKTIETGPRSSPWYWAKTPNPVSLRDLLDSSVLSYHMIWTLPSRYHMI